MSYCVNCGVELSQGEKKCPLCSTVVLNPNEPPKEYAQTSYPKNIDHIGIYKERKMTMLLLSVILALPVSICLVCNFIINNEFTWSIYVLGAAVVIWVLIVPPFLIRRGVLFWCMCLDVAVLGGFLYIVNRMAMPEKDWFRPLAMPVLVVAAAFSLVIAVVLRYARLAKLYNAAICLLCIGALLSAVEVITDAYLLKPIGFDWSPLVLIPCALLAIIYIIIERKKWWKNGLKKRLHM